MYFSKTINEFWALPGAWGPTIAAIILSYGEAGKKGVSKLLGKIRTTKVSFKYYLFALFVFLVLGVCRWESTQRLKDNCPICP